MLRDQSLKNIEPTAPLPAGLVAFHYLFDIGPKCSSVYLVLNH